MDRFDDIVGVVTGAASGIGRQIALGLSQLGVRLALVDLDADGLAETAALTSHPDRHRSYPVDVADPVAVGAAVRGIVADLGPPGLLVNSAGRLGPHLPAVWELTPRDWAQVFGANLYGSVNFVRALVPVMQAAKRPAHIVTIASIVGLVADGRLGAYAAAKHALVSFAETLRLELAARGADIGVTLVCPAGVPTNLNAAIRGHRAVSRSSSSDWLSAEEVAKQIIDAVRRGDFYLFTHPSSAERVRRYQQAVRDSFD
jgi:NAD(P)-dependent dehydrogenase (short-subunit alcohol dehydrogenase family)